MKLRFRTFELPSRTLLQPHRSPSFRAFSCSQLRPENETTFPSSPEPKQPDSRWLSNIKSRIGKCILFGVDREQTIKVAGVLRILGEEWRDLVAGREGFLVQKKRAGLLRQAIVWGEMDSMGHVNNVMYIRYAESARVNWAKNYAVHIDPEHKKEWNQLCTPIGNGLILKSIRTDYKFPMMWPDHISVFHKLRYPSKPTDTSFILDVMILSELHQRPAARCVEDIVMYDYKTGKKRGVMEFMMKGFEGTWREQEDARRRAESRIQEIEGVVREIECETWDRDGAVEDLGGGTK